MLLDSELGCNGCNVIFQKIVKLIQAVQPLGHLLFDVFVQIVAVEIFLLEQGSKVFELGSEVVSELLHVQLREILGKGCFCVFFRTGFKVVKKFLNLF
jgi:hypothetical protein